MKHKNKPKKSLGQHFLTSPKAVEAALAAADLKKSDTVLEIGPGEGILTSALLISVDNVIAVEKDEQLVTQLEQTFATPIVEKRLDIIGADILNFDTESLPAGYKVVANIPYYLTGAIIRKFMTAPNQPERVVLMVQKEVAERIIAADGKESVLSISVKAYGTPRFIKRVAAGSFRPAPKVDSAIIAIENINWNNFETGEQEKTFFNILKSGFTSKRKMLKNNLDLTEDQFQTCGISGTLRPEKVNLETWLCLAKNI